MAVTQPYSRIIVPGIGARRIRFAATALAVLIFVLLRDHWPWTVSYPRAWIVPATEWINSGMGWLIGSFDLGLFTFKEFTRGIAWTIAWPLKWTESLLVTGFGAGLFGVLPWLSVVGLAVILGHYIRGWRIACLAGACVLSGA